MTDQLPDGKSGFTDGTDFEERYLSTDPAQQGLFAAAEVPEEWEKHWKGMPEYQQTKQEAFAEITVRFSSREHVLEFGRRIGQPTINTQTRSIWYPKLARPEMTKWRDADTIARHGPHEQNGSNGKEPQAGSESPDSTVMGPQRGPEPTGSPAPASPAPPTVTDGIPAEPGAVKRGEQCGHCGCTLKPNAVPEPSLCSKCWRVAGGTQNGRVGYAEGMRA